jgi:hypothetical protein
VEEQRGEIAATWKRLVEDQLGGESAIAFAVGPILRELALDLRGEAPHSSRSRSGEGLARCAVLVRSGATPARVAREFKLLHRAIWDELRAAGAIVGADERRAADEWLDDALAEALDRIDRVRMRIDLLERGPAVVASRPSPARPAPSQPQRPPPLPRQGARPPPLPVPVSRLGDAHGE